jgi:hypothetical protein
MYFGLCDNDKFLDLSRWMVQNSKNLQIGQNLLFVCRTKYKLLCRTVEYAIIIHILDFFPEMFQNWKMSISKNISKMRSKKPVLQSIFLSYLTPT